jgi:GNAT superfamily N-acetyltransferase
MAAGFSVRRARPQELEAVGALTENAYAVEGYLDNDHDYGETLRDAQARAAAGSVLVAVDEADSLLGAVAVFTRDAGPDFAEQAQPGDAVVRMLVTAPAARGRGVGGALAQASVDLARELGCRRVRLSTQPVMTTAHRIYERLGFVRVPENDWEPVPGIVLLGYELVL